MNEQTRRDRSDTADAFVGFGVCILTAGVGLISVPAALIVLGVILLGLGLAAAVRKGG